MRINIHGLVKSFPGAHDGARTVLDGIELGSRSMVLDTELIVRESTATGL